MRIFIQALCVSVVLSTSAMAADGENPWTIKYEMRGKVASFIKNSPIIQEMHEFKLPNAMVYSINNLHGPMLPVYDLLACLHLTNPNSKMEVDSGGGYDIAMQGVQFPGGLWDVDIRFREVQQINMLESQNVYLLDRIIIGVTRLRDTNQKAQVVRQLSKVCYNAS